MTLLSTIPYLGAKLGSTLALLVITVAFSFLPFLIKKRVRRSGLIMSYCNCMAGGIVLGALLMHMVPEIMEQGHCPGHSAANRLARRNPDTNALMDTQLLPNTRSTQDAQHVHLHKPKQDHSAPNPGKASEGAKQDETIHSQDHDDDHDHGFAWGPFCAGVSFLLLFAIDRLFLTHSNCADAHISDKEMAIVDKSVCAQHGYDHDHNHHHKQLSIQPDAEHGSCHEDDVIGGCHSDGINASSSRLQTFVFVLALSIHSFLEGLGMATKNTKANLVSFLVSLFAHKWLEAFALGAGVAKACFSNTHSFLLIALYSLLTPAGILLGIGLEAMASGKFSLFHQALLRQILDGLALGSFLFVSCIEMIPSEFHKTTKHTPFKFILLSLGFVAMAIISALHTH